ncbi:MAG: hypothetical protein ACK6C4_00310, partial [Bacteroidota bacterium]
MRPDLQQVFNGGVTTQSHADLIASLERRLGHAIEFRVCEMPIIISSAFASEMSSAAQEIIEECLSAENLERSAYTLQSRYSVRHESARPLFSVVDFAVTTNESGAYVPRLIELQGFPSLFGYQWMLTQEFMLQYGLNTVTPC